MKKIILGFALTAALFCSAVAAPTQFKHMNKGVNCEMCHASATPAGPAKAKSCNKCHNYADLAKKTAKPGKLNPHDSHAGELRCTLCHKEHSDSVVYCKQCHKANDERFNFKTP